jgi:hypothetical protein
MSANLPFKSETKPYTPGSTTDFFDFVPPRGPNGGRVVIDRLIVCLVGVVTNAGSALDGRDVPRFINLATVDQRDNRQRWSLSGFKSRIMSIHLNGADQHQEHADIAVGAAQPVNLRLVIPFSKRFLHRPEDFAIPSDVFRKITISWAQLASVQTGTAALSAAALNAYILADWHEEYIVEFKCEDVIKSVDFNSTSQAKLSCSGAVQDLLFVREPAGGGTPGGDLVSALTDARCEDLNTPVLTYADLLHDYAMKRWIAPSGTTANGAERYKEPSRQGIMVPFMSSDPDTSFWDGITRDSLKIDVNGGSVGQAAISREVIEKSQSTYNAVCSRFGINPNGNTVMVRTKNGKEESRAAGWNQRDVMVAPWYAPLTM